jgi:outer membrane protein assembly factor BamB
MPLANNERLIHVQFLSDHELLLVNSDKVSVYDFKKDQPVWSKSLASYRSKPPPSPSPTELADEAGDAAKPATPQTTAAQQAAQRKLAAQLATYEDYFDAGPSARVVGDAIWVTLGRNVICFDRATGAEKAKTQVEGRIQEMTFGDNAMVVVSAKGAYDYVFTRIELPSGAPQSEQRSLPPPPPRPVKAFDPDAPVQEDLSVPAEQHQFVAAGSTVAELDVKLVEKKFVSVQTMKALKTGQFDEGIKVTQTREVAEDVFNEMRMRDTGGVAKVDVSRYAVTLQRVFGKDAAPWTGEVVGPPSFFTLKTVDVLVAGKVMYVFNKNDQLMWQSNLSYPIARQFRSHESEWGGSRRDSAVAPCLERGDTLYFFDQGVLTAFEVKSGKARWRMPSVGVSSIQFDDKGMLYVATTSAGPESIQYYEQVSMDRIEPIIVKVDPATGRALWRVEKVGDECHLSGKYVYLTRAQTSSLDVIASMSKGGGGGIPTHFRLYRLNPKNGQQLWECYRPTHPSQLDFHGNEILLQFHDKLEVLKFLSL